MQTSNVRIVRVYYLSLSVAASVFALSLYEDWKQYELSTVNLLIQQATVTNKQIESALLDASRLLDIAKAKAETEISHNRFSDFRAHTILKSTVSDFKTYKTNNVFGLLFYVDKEGTIEAENGTYPSPHIDVRDRLYFTKLKENPSRDWYVGAMVVGRRNQNKVFHLAVPLRGIDGNSFYGILMQQILANDVSDLLSTYSSASSTKTRTFQQDGYVSYAFPANADDTSRSEIDEQFFLIGSQAATSAPGWKKLLANDSKDKKTYYVGFDRSSIFHTVTTVSIPLQSVVTNFLIARVKLILFAVAGWAFISFLFYRLNTEINQREKAREMSLRDPLTKLYNRRALDNEFSRLWKDAQRTGLPISALFIDIDHFKKFNDKYGHEVGDQTLKSVASAIAHCMKRPLDFCCRWGGEEFVVILPQTDQVGATLMATDVMNTIRAIDVKDTATTLTVSIGIATALVTDKNFSDDLVDMADKAMMTAKNEGRDCWRTIQST